jgi:AcrR family transcriptional regulator
MKAVKSKTKASGPRRKTDRRVLRTRDTLGDALVALMQEKNFDEITVREVLDRAGVGRSTFYAHYRDKDDLFLSDVEDFLGWCSTALKRHNPGGKRLLPVEEFFGHVRDVRQFYAALVRSGKMNDVQDLARGFFARSIEERLEDAGVKIEPARRSAQAHALAGSFFSLLEWWVDRGMKADPKEMDELFHRMAWSGLGR